jgi:hypothetical protein
VAKLEAQRGEENSIRILLSKGITEDRIMQLKGKNGEGMQALQEMSANAQSLPKTYRNLAGV